MRTLGGQEKSLYLSVAGIMIHDSFPAVRVLSDKKCTPNPLFCSNNFTEFSTESLSM